MSPAKNLDLGVLHDFKAIVRASDANVRIAFDLLFDKLKKNNSQVLLLLLLLRQFVSKPSLSLSLSAEILKHVSLSVSLCSVDYCNSFLTQLFLVFPLWCLFLCPEISSHSRGEEIFLKLRRKSCRALHAVWWQVRYLTLLLIDELFRRSKLFRSLLVPKFEMFMLLTIGYRADYTLPKPSDRATLLRATSMEYVEKWNEMFGVHYKPVHLGYEYLKKTLRLQFPNVREAAAMAERQRQEKEERTQVFYAFRSSQGLRFRVYGLSVLEPEPFLLVCRYFFKRSMRV
jgi:hypothetical protein